MQKQEIADTRDFQINNQKHKYSAAIGRKAAVKSSSTASGFGSYQSKEPVALKHMLNENKFCKF